MKQHFKKGEHMTTEQFVEKARQAHGDRYDYSLINYRGSRYKVKIVCRAHGAFEQRVADHWNGRGCRECFNVTTRTWTKEQDAFLKQHYVKDGLAYCMGHLGKTDHAIHARAGKLWITRDYKDWPYKILCRARWTAMIQRAEEKGFDMDLTPEFIEQMYADQGGFCALTGWPIVFHKDAALNTCSIDRIDSDKGYITTNVQIVHKRVNRCKLDNSDEDFYAICKAIVKHRTHDLARSTLEWEWDEWGDTEKPMKREVVGLLG